MNDVYSLTVNETIYMIVILFYLFSTLALWKTRVIGTWANSGNLTVLGLLLAEGEEAELTLYF